MKNIFVGLVFVAGFAMSAAFAEPKNIDLSSPKIDDASCELLGQEVTFNLSKNVVGSYDCSKDDNIMKVATCHEAGSRKIDTVQCSQTEVNGELEWNDTSCTAVTDTFKTGNFGKAFRATTGGGGVAPVSLASICADASVLTAVSVK